MAFHKKVYAGFLKVKNLYPDRFVTIDASQPIDDVVNQVIETLEKRLPEIF